VRRLARVLIAVATALVSSGCLVVSLQPAYDAASVVFDEALVGRWANAADETSAVIEAAQWRAYKIAYTDRFTTLTFHANLTKVGAATYLDLTQVRGADAGPYLVPVHGVVRVAVAGPALTVTPLDYNWFMEAAGTAPIRSLATALDDRRNVVVASTTAELRRWLAQPPANAFSAPMTFTRRP
jgi:hypothetical protein